MRRLSVEVRVVLALLFVAVVGFAVFSYVHDRQRDDQLREHYLKDCPPVQTDATTCE